MSNPSKRSVLLLAEVAASVVLLAACGGGGSSPAAPAVDSAANASDAAATTDEAALPSNDSSAVVDASVDATDGVGTAVVDEEAAIAAAAADAAAGGNTVSRVPDDSGSEYDAPEGAAALGSEPAPLPERDDAQATVFAKPKVAALDYSGNFSSDRSSLLARHGLVLLGLSRSMSSSSMGSAVNGIRSRNSSVKIGQYVLINELKCSASSSSPFYSLVQAANSANWWLRRADGTRAQWTTAYGACDMNVTSWGRKNSAGQTWTQYKWQQDRNSLFNKARFDYVFIDNFWYMPRVTADYRRNSTNQSPGDSTIQSAWRAGLASYVNHVRGSSSSQRVMGNINSDLSQSSHVNLLDGALIEGAIGKSWSRETWAGWKSAYDRYRTAIRNTRSPKDVIFQTFANPTDYKMVRYGLASAMMDNGWFMYIPLTGTMQPKWFDEFDARIGTAVEAPPTAPTQNGIYKRRYSNGLVLVNPSKTSSASIQVGSGYKRLSGAQDRAVNNGATQSSVTLPARSGLLMLRTGS